MDRMLAALRTIEDECRRIQKSYAEAGTDIYEVMHCVSPKYTGALRRASLDLTRALAEMRKP
jgi:hypothetical protein